MGFTFPNPQPQPELPPARADRILARGNLASTAAAIVGCSTVSDKQLHSGATNGFDAHGKLYLSDHRALVADFGLRSTLLA